MCLQMLTILAQASGAGESGPAAGFALIPLVLFVIVAAMTIFWLWMLIDSLTRPATTNEKLLWFLVVFLLAWLGAIIYYFVGRKPKPAP